MVGYVRQTGIDIIKYEELIMKLAVLLIYWELTRRRHIEYLKNSLKRENLPSQEAGEQHIMK